MPQSPPRRLHLAAFCWAAAIGLVAPRAAADGLTVEQAIRLAVRNNERARIAHERVEQAEGDRDTARAAFLPSLTVGSAEIAKPTADVFGRYLTESVTTTITQPLFAPSALPTYWAAGHALESAKWGADDAVLNLEHDTARAFLGVLAAAEVLDASEGRYDRAKTNLDLAQARVDAQISGINDVTRARLDVANAQHDLDRAKGDVERARLGLRLLIGQDVKGDVVEPDALERAADSFAGDGPTLTRMALDTRYDVKAGQETILALRDTAREPLYRMAPTLSLIGQEKMNPDPRSNDRTIESWHDETLTLALNWTVFDGGVRYGQRRSRLAQQASAEWGQSLLIRTVDHDVQAALVALDTARAAMHDAQTAVEQAKKSADETAELAARGLARAIEISDANTSRFEAEVNLAQARLDLATAYLQLRLALGLPPIDAPVQGGPRR